MPSVFHWLRQAWVAVASLRLTVACLSLAMVLVLAGTLAQVSEGLYAAQDRYFRSFFVWGAVPLLNWPFPVFPGGYFLGTVLLLNLIAAHTARFRLSWKKAGIHLIHGGLIFLLAGQLLTDLFSVETQMVLDEGQTKNWSEDPRRTELVFIDTSPPDDDIIYSIPERRLARATRLEHGELPFTADIVAFYPNAELRRKRSQTSGALPQPRRGAFRFLEVTEKPRTTKLNERDLSAVVFELTSRDGHSLGRWLASNALAEAQAFVHEGKTWNVQLRQERYYRPFSLTLLDFSHEKYPGTDIPNHFSSRVTLRDASQNEEREILISMNQPLRTHGETFYQASFANQDRTSILQVVRNPSWLLPYLSCTLIFAGLITQFGFHLLSHLRRRSS